MRFFPQSLFMLLLILAATACYTPRGLHNKTLAQPEKPVFDFLMLFVPTDEDIHQLDEQTYERLLKGNFNDLQHKTFRDHLGDRFRKSFEGTFVHDYQNFFTGHHRYSYEEFQNALAQNRVNHILLITLKSEKSRVSPIITSDMAIPVNYTHRSYQLYLFDVNRPQPLWLSYGFPTSTGGLSGIRTTARELARGVAREMEREQLLYTRGGK
jgi:hypothetical protein